MISQFAGSSNQYKINIDYRLETVILLILKEPVNLILRKTGV